MSVYFIAEIGINHNGDLNLAKRLINIASFAGCDCVKFQKRNPDICVPDHQKNIIRETPWGAMTYLDYKKRMEFGKEEYDEINSLCRELNIDWSVSVWDIDSLNFMDDYDIPFIKIPSALLTNEELLKAVRNKALKRNIRILLSTGMSSLEEIDEAVNILKDCHLSLLHCNSSYPAKVDELNLKCIPFLRMRYARDVGYSGHELRTGTTVSTVCLGVSIIERHVTLDRTMWGTDHIASLEPEGLISTVRAIRDLEKALGTEEKIITEAEELIRTKLRG